MRIFSFLNRHNRLAALADAFVDGELAGEALDEFQLHLRSCERCSRAVAQAQAAKFSIAQLPVVEVPRSFRLTPSMVAASRPGPHRANTPLYLGLARVGAALSVAAFASVSVVSAFDSSSNSANDEATALREAAGDFSMDAAGGSPSESEPDKSALPESTRAALPPATGGQVVSSGVGTPVIESTPPAPSTGVDNGYEQPGNSSTNPEAPSEALSTVAYDPDAAGEASSRSWPLISLGVLAVAAVIVLAGLEGLRRIRR